MIETKSKRLFICFEYFTSAVWPFELVKITRFVETAQNATKCNIVASFYILSCHICSENKRNAEAI